MNPGLPKKKKKNHPQHKIQEHLDLAERQDKTQEAAKLPPKYFAVPSLLLLLLLPPSARSPPRPREAEGIVPPPGALVDSGERSLSAPRGSAPGFRPRPRGRLAAGGSVAGARVSWPWASRPPRSRVSSSGAEQDLWIRFAVPFSNPCLIRRRPCLYIRVAGRKGAALRHRRPPAQCCAKAGKGGSFLGLDQY